MEKANVYQMVTNSIIAQMENGIIPWAKPWVNMMGCVSHTNGKPYSLLNQFLLGKAGEWLTFNQIQKEGGSIKKGEKASFVVFWKQFVVKEKDEQGNETEKVIPMLRYYNVWHIDQVKGIEPKYTKNVDFENEPIEGAEKVVSEYFGRENATLRIGEFDHACYYPSADMVEIPTLNQFKYVEQYYSTLFHEMTHSTGHKDRLKRNGVMNITCFGSCDYSKEELIAEMGSAFIMSYLGFETEKSFTNSVAYLQSWLKVLKGDAKFIVAAAGKAEKAANYILNIKD